MFLCLYYCMFSQSLYRCGRGGKINFHLGNIIFRRLVDENKEVYHQIPKKHRNLVSQSIVQTMHNYGSRFLEKKGDYWELVSDRKAVQKTSQALREKED